jgi:hypothetical protein
MVTKELRKKKAEDDATLQKVLELAKGIEVPASSIARDDAGDIALQLVQATEEVQEMVTSEVGNMLMIVGEKAAEEVQEDEAAGSEAATLEASKR